MIEYELNTEVVKNTILFFLLSDYAWTLYLSYRQYKKICATTEVPSELSKTISKETFEKARLYTLATNKFHVINVTYSVIQSSVIIHYGILSHIWDYASSINPFSDEISTSCIWISIFSTLLIIANLPLTIYNTFILEEKFGFNKQTIRFFIWDVIKSFLVEQTIMIVVSSIAIRVIKISGEFVFVWASLVYGILIALGCLLIPTVISPLFDKFTPLPEGELRTQIENLAAQVEFPLTELYLVEGSMRSAHSNAYMTGFFKAKRIVLYDTLLAKDGSGCTNDEILAILAHELGHWKYNHIMKQIAAVEVNAFLVFAGFSLMFRYQPIYSAFGFYNSQPVLAGLLIIWEYAMIPYNRLYIVLFNCYSRRCEVQTDAFASKLGKAKSLSSALVQLYIDNLVFPVCDDLYSAYYHDHPTLLERLRALKN